MSAVMAVGDRALPTVVGAALGVVVATGLLFAGIGAVRGEPADVANGGAGSTPIAGGTEDATSEPEGQDGDEGVAPSPLDDGSTTDASPTDGADGGTGDDAATADESTSDDGATTDDAGTTDDAASTDDSGSADDGATADDTASDTEPAVDPASISIQVLDGVGTDNRRTANAVADELRAGGFDVVVVNRASVRYDVTTVFWTEGQGPGGRAVAAFLGTDEARVTPEEVRLSDSVDVHVVVGSDR